IHTPDSSRFWYADSYKADPLAVKALDKEFVRQWLLENPDSDGKMRRKLPHDVMIEARQRYLDIYRLITGVNLETGIENWSTSCDRLAHNMQRAGLIKDCFVAIVMGSSADLEFARKIEQALEPYEVAIDLRVVSAHKNGERLTEIAHEYNNSIEPGVVIALAGRSNGLGGALAANLNIPVINCPPFKDTDDYLVNIHSSLQMPSQTPALTVVSPDNAALAAIRCLNLHRLRDLTSKSIRKLKWSLISDDEMIRSQGTCKKDACFQP
ncbi:MAG: phosphoribosylaminoimidazolesuccinocarboxamide synthase, partial [Candidatus Riflebacteria bacterium]